MDSLQVQFLGSAEVSITGPAALNAWRDKHTLKVPGHEYVPRFRSGAWDGTWAPGKWCTLRSDGTYELRCSRGLLPRIAHDVTGGAMLLQAATAAEVNAFRATVPQVAQLRDYQGRALAEVLTKGWGRIAFATNAGKGAVIALLAAFARWRGNSALILCDEIAVFDALRGEVTQWGKFEPALIRAGTKVPPDAAVTIAMVPTLSRRVMSKNKAEAKAWREWLGARAMLLMDEADKADAMSWRTIIAHAKNTTWRAGFSGTFPSDLYNDLRLDELMGPVLDRVQNTELVERGVSARPTIEVCMYDASHCLQLFPREWWGMTPPQQRNFVFTRAITANVDRHQFVAALIQPDTPTAVIVNRIAHGQDLVATIPGAVFLDGSSSDDERLCALQDFAEGKVRVLVVTRIFDRGTNRLGLAADVIFASAEGSASQILQRIGRGLRRVGGKEFLRVVDIVDRVQTEGVTDKRVKMSAAFLHKGARRRLEVYAKEGFEVQIVSSP